MTAASPYLLYKVATTPKYRKGLSQRIGLKLPPRPEKAPIWCHAVSVGEVIAVSELLRQVKARWPGIPLYISTVTATGQETAKSKLGDLAEAIFYLPFDIPPVVKAVVERVNPRLFLLVETELWPGLIMELKERGIPQVLINGRLSPGSFRNYHAFKRLMVPLLLGFHRLCMQSRRDAARMVSLGAPAHRVIMTGNLKYDTILASLDGIEASQVRSELGIPENAKVVVAGSTHQGEEEALLGVLSRCVGQDDTLLVLAPRHPERWDEVARLIEARGIPLARRSRGEPLNHARVMLLDTMGELATSYAAANVAFVGGSLAEVGGHNPLEPAALGVPVVTGPHLFNFQEISQMLTGAGGMKVCSNPEQVVNTICGLLEDKRAASLMGEKGKKAVFQNKGAIEKTMKEIEKAIEARD